jgi:hypothetical protein
MGLAMEKGEKGKHGSAHVERSRIDIGVCSFAMAEPPVAIGL